MAVCFIHLLPPPTEAVVPNDWLEGHSAY